MFVPADFLDMGSREAVDVVLHRLTRKGVIRRLARGVYDFPKKHPALGLLSPSAEAVAKALAGATEHAFSQRVLTRPTSWGFPNKCPRRRSS